MNFYYSILGLVSVLMLKYQQLFYISAVPSQKTISFFMELHELAILGKNATEFKLNYLFQVLLSMQITKATSTKLKREKRIFVFLTAENVGFMNPGFFFSLEFLTEQGGCHAARGTTTSLIKHNYFLLRFTSSAPFLLDLCFRSFSWEAKHTFRAG